MGAMRLFLLMLTCVSAFGQPKRIVVIANDDNLSAASTEYYGKLKAAHVHTELHIYLTAGHGFGMTGRTPVFRSLPVEHWPDQLQEWMRALGFLQPVTLP
jgi:acetyl esterase/lipase